jgi:hypothetical protein
MFPKTRVKKFLIFAVRYSSNSSNGLTDSHCDQQSGRKIFHLKSTKCTTTEDETTMDEARRPDNIRRFPIIFLGHYVQHEYYFCIYYFSRSRDSSVGIATGYGLDDRGVGVRVAVGSWIFSSPRRPDRLKGPPNLLTNGYRGLFPRGKVAGAWSWPRISN